MTINEIHEALNSGKKVYWSNTSYQVLKTSPRKGCEYQENHFTLNNNELLEIRCTSNWFGGLMGKEEENNCFIK